MKYSDIRKVKFRRILPDQMVFLQCTSPIGTVKGKIRGTGQGNMSE